MTSVEAQSSFESSARAPDNLLCLTNCPACDYSLESLPPQGRCPECGRCYDQTVVVLTGRGRGRFDTLAGGTWRSIVSFIVIAACLVFIGSKLRIDTGLGSFAYIIALLGLAVLHLGARVLSPRTPRMQLWLSPEGVAQVPSTPEARRVLEFENDTALNSIAVFTILMLSNVGPRQAFQFFVILVIGLSLLFWRVSRYRNRVRKNEAEDEAQYVPSWYGWRLIEDFSVEPVSDAAVRVNCHAYRMWRSIKLFNLQVASIELQITDAQQAELLNRVKYWRQRAEKECGNGI